MLIAADHFKEVDAASCIAQIQVDLLTVFISDRLISDHLALHISHQDL